MKKRWIDWVELGCRGWEIDKTGAGLNERDDEWAHLDRTTLHLFVGGRPDWRKLRPFWAWLFRSSKHRVCAKCGKVLESAK